MGGLAFSHQDPPLKTPRMPTEIYKIMRDSVLNLLLKDFTDAKTPIEAPGKDDYGDIDVLCHSPLTPDLDPAKTDRKQIAATIGTKMGAHAWIIGKGEQAMNFAIPWPKRKYTQKMDDGSIVEIEVDYNAGNYIQVDIHICKDYKTFRWAYFHAAHGDLWNILGTTIRKFGLTVNDKGMFVRIPEIEQLDKKKSMIFLTEDPCTILAFLGLDHVKWFQEFSSKKKMFEYAATCRLFWVKDAAELEDGLNEGDVVGDIGNGGQEGGDTGKKKLKHNDRQRMSKRPIYKEWIDEFIPHLRAEGKYLEQRATRDQVRDEALAQFGVKQEWDARLKEWKLSRHNDELWRDVIKGGIPDMVNPQRRAATIRHMKEIIMEGGIFQGYYPEAAKTDEDGFHDLDKVRAFVAENWEAVSKVGWKKQVDRATEHMREVSLEKEQGQPQV
ncbi:uncharacterized protein LY89DRAFT_356596 [Mollisia scopiformis]|uniref:Uncharacterized protein n=1 Tax=Mollisia scopiformis TaxID=149040 RepID=A0A132B536_MOLSC|nr:uncharacterized protein LY89DRAFT_356596 [Mollisia scopiformis]KUJ07528.1 hypothetical protein LY89DRAFT_356596 [Mollisia scopiformis]